MEPPTDKLRKISGAIIKKRGQNASSIRPNLLQKQYLASLDLNQPAEDDSQDQYNFEVEPTMMGTRKISVDRSMVNENIDLSWTSSSPGSSSNNLHNAVKSPMLGFELGGTSKQDPPSVSVKGCKLCMMFVIVTKDNPNCPRCKAHMMVVDNV